jgi:V/A-type H+-transporting ATPase subunit D
MTEREVTPTRSAFLELKDEREGMREGYSFLDEKRLILASEILAELGRYETEMAEFRDAYAKAGAILEAAAARHGLEGLELYPAAHSLGGRMRVTTRSVLGVILHEVTCDLAGSQPPAPAVAPSPEAEQCRDAFRDLVPRAAHLAALTGNLERLRLEYARTARRARALEDVLLPEIDQTLKAIDAALEEMEREEAVRVRHLDRGS